jgi:hypothetical protein
MIGCHGYSGLDQRVRSPRDGAEFEEVAGDVDAPGRGSSAPPVQNRVGGVPELADRLAGYRPGS